MFIVQNGTYYTSFARGFADALIDPSKSWFPSFDGTSLSRFALFGGDGYSYTLYGPNLSVDENDRATGKVNKVEVYETGSQDPIIVARKIRKNVEDLVEASAQIGGDFTSEAFQGFKDILGIGDQKGSPGLDIMETDADGGTVKTGRGNDRVIFDGSFDPEFLPLAIAEAKSNINAGKGRNDLLIMEGPERTVENENFAFSIDLKKGNIELVEFIGNDAIRRDLSDIGGFERVRGTDMRDFIIGDEKDNKFWGQLGNDSLLGRDGDDTLLGQGGRDDLYGGSGDDSLDGGSGRDTLEGNAGNDTLTGGAASDVFRFRPFFNEDLDPLEDFGTDVITDFDKQADRLAISEEFGAVPLGDITVQAEAGGTRIIVDNAELKGEIFLEGVSGITIDNLDTILD